MSSESLHEKVQRVLRDRIEVVPYDPAWPGRFEAERAFLRERFPGDLITRIEHFGSTAVPGLAAKPVIDLLVGVRSLARTQVEIAPMLESLGYDYFWRATHGDAGPPFYAWFIKRDAAGQRTHHLHFVEPHFEHWDRLLFRDYLRQHPETAAAYAALKLRLAAEFPDDRVRYTREKTAFVVAVTNQARAEVRNQRSDRAPDRLLASGIRPQVCDLE
ncbi:GrpB family protein [Opitutus sp. ER46]|uniref:GrpB family protein n=1 Tax=Opitutus sp. ER46 TaxID=2161864 RepID=UPI000D30894E|nr:GrpB family protein [Opitutus sp. ER46]PTX97882.1 GrpB family protein [Opitutus sp. ER46]